MGPIRLCQKKIIAQPPPAWLSNPSFKKFDDVNDLLELPRSWNVVVRIDVKFPVEPRYHDKQHFIFVDINGTKVEAISYNNDVHQFDSLLQQGCIYTLRGVVFGTNWVKLNFGILGIKLS